MRESGQRIVVAYPHNSDYQRRGVLVKVIERLRPESLERPLRAYTDIWEVLLDPIGNRPAKTTTYNECWLWQERYATYPAA